jgi:hypothetical protein
MEKGEERRAGEGERREKGGRREKGEGERREKGGRREEETDLYCRYLL